jgi:Uma2 family endonuclease
MSSVVETISAPLANRAEDPYAIGYRDIYETSPTGERIHRRIALTMENFLHPEDGDFFMAGQQHDEIRRYLSSVFDARLAPDEHALVLADVNVYWDEPGFGHHGPDVTVIFGLPAKPKNLRSYFVEENDGRRPRVVVEVTSPSTRSGDLTDKFNDYHALGIPFYVLVDRADFEDPWTVTVYQRTAHRYFPGVRDEAGRVWLEPLSVWLEARSDRVVCYDDVTQEELGNYAEVRQALQLETQRADAERVRAESERERADAELQRADAERERADAERERADAERERADAALKRIAEMEAELARLRGQSN